MASIAFFLPLTASRVYETTYVLSFKAINNCMIQATLAITTFLLMVLVSAIPSVKLLKVFLPAATVISILCQIVIAFTQSESSLFVLHLYISVQLSVSILAALRMSFDSGRPSNADGAGRQESSWSALSLGLSLSPVPTGLVVAQFLSNVTFQLEDTYFTKASGAREKIKWLNLSLAVANSLVLLLTLVKMPDSAKNAAHYSRCSHVRSWLRTPGFWANAISVAAWLISFFVLVPQWNYICNQFFFTFDQAHGFMLFFACGASWAGLAADVTIGKLGPKAAIWVPFLLYSAAIGTLLVTVEFAPDIWLTRFLCLLIGASLFTNFIRSLQTSLFWLDDK